MHTQLVHAYAKLAHPYATLTHACIACEHHRSQELTHKTCQPF
jgi:hypothetical protein